MNATKRLDMLLSDLVHHERSPLVNGTSQDKSIEPLSTLTFAENDFYPNRSIPSSILSPMAPLLPRRDPASLKLHRRHVPNNLQSQPLLNSSTLDDLFRALTLECEQYLAASASPKSQFQTMLVKSIQVDSTNNKQRGVESNDEDYENLQPNKPQFTVVSPLKTSIEVISPIKRHVVSISVSSKMSTPMLVSSSISYSTNQANQTNGISMIESAPPRSSEDDQSKSVTNSSNPRRRRRRTRKRMISSTTTRSSSSSTERKETGIEKKVTVTKRSFSTDYRHQRLKDLHDNPSSSLSTKKAITTTGTRRMQRRDVSLQNPSLNRSTCHQDRFSPLSVMLTSSSKSTSDFLDQTPTPQFKQRRSRLESVIPKPLSLLDRMHQQFYRSSSTQNQKTNNIPIHRMSSYLVH